VSVRDPDGRRPEEFDYAGARFVGEVPPVSAIGRGAAERALSRLGSRKAESAAMTLVLDNRAAGRLVGALGQPLSGMALQQKRSFLEGKLGEAIASPLFDVADDPHTFGSRLYDNEGIATRRMPIFEKGVLRHYFIDTYYGKKLKLAPTTGGLSNLVFTLGPRSQAEILKDRGRGHPGDGLPGRQLQLHHRRLLVRHQGLPRPRRPRAEPVGEMNIAGNLGELLRKLAAVGNDPWPYSSLRTPTLVFEAVQFCGNLTYSPASSAPPRAGRRASMRRKRTARGGKRSSPRACCGSR
jgi:PmbA protein